MASLLVQDVISSRVGGLVDAEEEDEQDTTELPTVALPISIEVKVNKPSTTPSAQLARESEEKRSIKEAVVSRPRPVPRQTRLGQQLFIT